MNEWQVNLDAKYDEGFDIEPDLRSPMRQFQKWVDTVGMHRLKHLRDFTLALDTCYKPWRCVANEFRVVFDPKLGLQVHLPNIRCPPIEVQNSQMSRHVARCQLETEKKEWKGEGIIYYFLDDKDFWATWFWTFVGTEEDEDDEDDEDGNDDEDDDEDDDENEDDEDEYEDEGDEFDVSYHKSRMRIGKRKVAGYR